MMRDLKKAVDWIGLTVGYWCFHYSKDCSQAQAFLETPCLSADNALLDWKSATFALPTSKPDISIFVVLFSANSFFISLCVFSFINVHSVSKKAL